MTKGVPENTPENIIRRAQQLIRTSNNPEEIKGHREVIRTLKRQQRLDQWEQKKWRDNMALCRGPEERQERIDGYLSRFSQILEARCTSPRQRADAEDTIALIVDNASWGQKTCGLNAVELSDYADISEQVMYQRLQFLEDMGVIKRIPNGRSKLIVLNPPEDEPIIKLPFKVVEGGKKDA